MSDKHTEFPYKSLGLRLKKERQKLQETLAEVSGAVEIDIDLLQDIEHGLKRPSEDVLLLLVSHFALSEDAAASLWSLAGYDATSDSTGNNQQTVFVMPLDVRIVYADMAHVTANDYGVVVNFLQSGGPNSQPLAISRVGMSKEHAQSVLHLLQEALDQTNQPKVTRALSSPKPTRKRKSKADEHPKN